MTPHQVIVMLLREIDHPVLVNVGSMCRLRFQSFAVVVSFGANLFFERRHDGEFRGVRTEIDAENLARSPCGPVKNICSSRLASIARSQASYGSYPSAGKPCYHVPTALSGHEGTKLGMAGKGVILRLAELKAERFPKSGASVGVEVLRINKSVSVVAL